MTAVGPMAIADTDPPANPDPGVTSVPEALGNLALLETSAIAIARAKGAPSEGTRKP